MTVVRPVRIASGRHPFEVAVLVAIAAGGAALLVSDRRPPSVTAAMPALVQAAWEISLVVSCAIALAGVWWRGALSTAFALELLGMILLGTAATMYAIALFAVSGLNAAVAGSFVSGVAVAAWWRSWQILRDVRRVARATEDGVTAEVTLLAERGPS